MVAVEIALLGLVLEVVPEEDAHLLELGLRGTLDRPVAHAAEQLMATAHLRVLAHSTCPA